MSWPGIETFGICPECGRRALLRFTGKRWICPMCFERLFNNGDGEHARGFRPSGVQTHGGNA